MKSQIIINEIFHSIPKYNAFSFEELIAFAQPNVDPQRLKRKILKDGRFIYIQSEAIEDEYKRASEHMFVLEDFARGTFMEESVTATLKYKLPVALSK